MAILTSDYEHMQNGQPQDFQTTKEYRDDFKNQDITSAQALITDNNSYLVMSADKLNDLCDTITYMQEIWDDDKSEFVNKYFRLTRYDDSQYTPMHTYNTGDLVIYSDESYICISDNVTGEWDDSKWIRIGNDDVGLKFIGVREAGHIYPNDELWVMQQDSLGHYTNVCLWHSGNRQIGITRPNIRYIMMGAPSANEIYMCDYDGGEA